MQLSKNKRVLVILTFLFQVFHCLTLSFPNGGGGWLFQKFPLRGGPEKISLGGVDMVKGN